MPSARIHEIRRGLTQQQPHRRVAQQQRDHRAAHIGQKERRVQPVLAMRHRHGKDDQRGQTDLERELRQRTDMRLRDIATAHGDIAENDHQIDRQRGQKDLDHGSFRLVSGLVNTATSHRRGGPPVPCQPHPGKPRRQRVTPARPTPYCAVPAS
ncbi:hypothetical protein [Pararhodobacter zhoushanensis]|uniref:Uncharacterized protein n=1 Tax=Pararhodobacter zhoushanensis TaxID=2479545 RepID=A0ABT3GXL1_9RHOB|nr:hypothetical protein [Pararhodobacter zhoushanensis]MCW1932230.1 hypothetical protein [Pararhodobacter zhoushanensis]